MSTRLCTAVLLAVLAVAGCSGKTSPSVTPARFPASTTTVVASATPPGSASEVAAPAAGGAASPSLDASVSDAESSAVESSHAASAPSPAALPTAHAGGAQPSAAAVSDEGCRVEEGSGDHVQLSSDGQGGVGWDEYPSCAYVATVAGGYEAAGSWRIEIVRDGTRFAFTIDSADAPPCGTGVIQPGDEVRAYLRKGVNSPDGWFIAVGSAYGC